MNLAATCAERTVYAGEGTNFLFVDGHAEFIAEPRASQLFELMRTGAAETRP